MQFLNLVLSIAFTCVTLVCIVEFIQIHSSEQQKEEVFVAREVGELVNLLSEDQTSHISRRLSSDTTPGSDAIVLSVSENPFMNQMCVDMIQDKELQISVKSISVIVVARNEEKLSLINTVSTDFLLFDHQVLISSYLLSTESIILLLLFLRCRSSLYLIILFRPKL